MKSFRDRKMILLTTTLFVASATFAVADEVGKLGLSQPQQTEKFFSPDRFFLTNSTGTVKPLVEPHLSVSHDAREADSALGVLQSTDRIHGEAGGKLNLLGDVSLATFAKIPVYTKETVGTLNSPEGSSNSELLKGSNKLSWRSELGVPVTKGVDLNLFYDNSTIGKIDKPGVESREEKFGTRFIFKFK
jgi:hypothetical protein